MNTAWPYLVTFAVASFLCWGLTAHAARFRLIDVPNERSSHQNPTPRGGGLAVFAAWAIGLGLLTLDAQLATEDLWLVVACTLVIAGLGFWDDYRPLSAKLRLVVQIGVAMLLVWRAGGITELTIGGATLRIGPFGIVCSVLFVVWKINLYNFMDGIDGIAVAQCLSACISVLLLKSQFAVGVVPVEAFMALATACIAFGFWNFPKAKLFLGDVGSAAMGMFFAACALTDAKADSRMLWVWVILLGGFIFDATYTLCRRAIRREKLMQAHRSHLYQRLAAATGGHVFVTIGYFAISMFVLLPASCLVMSGTLSAFAGWVAAYLVLAACTAFAELFLRAQRTR